MGLFDRLIENTKKTDEKYILFAKAGLVLSKIDNDFSEEENDWIVEYFRSKPEITNERLEKILTKGSENLEELTSLSKLETLDDKKEFINFLINVAEADGKIDEAEFKFLMEISIKLDLVNEYKNVLKNLALKMLLKGIG
jgi:tellurite resistance protein